MLDRKHFSRKKQRIKRLCELVNEAHSLNRFECLGRVEKCYIRIVHGNKCLSKGLFGVLSVDQTETYIKNNNNSRNTTFLICI